MSDQKEGLMAEPVSTCGACGQSDDHPKHTILVGLNRCGCGLDDRPFHVLRCRRPPGRWELVRDGHACSQCEHSTVAGRWVWTWRD